jgi:arylsulfatase A-like enzyme
MLTRRAMLGATAASLSAATARRNVLFLSVDDMNDWVGCLGGYPGVQTPNIDRLARRGALFRAAHCSSPLCNPSRTALLTGWGAHRTGIYNNEQWWRPHLPGAVTLPMYFRRHGYYAAGAGKVFHHVAGFNPPDQWDDFQLQEFDDPWYRRAEWYPWVKKVPNPPGHPFNGLSNFQGEFDWGVIPGRSEQDYGDMRAVDYARRFLARRQEKPFFLAVGLWHPHIPMFAPQKYFDLYPPNRVRLPEVPDNDLDDLPKQAQEFAAFRRDEHERIVREGKWRDAVRAYLASISFADAMVGEIIRALESSPYAGNTVIVFWSDNGWHLGEKRHWHKSTLWERSTRVPLIFAGAGVQQVGRDRRQPVTLLDLYPTLIELCGLPRRDDLDGESLMPLLERADARRERPAVITYLPGNHSVRTERWRYTRYHDGGEELYDHETDPNEWRNLATEARHATLKQELARWMPATSAPPAPERTAYDFDFATHTWSRK